MNKRRRYKAKRRRRLERLWGQYTVLGVDWGHSPDFTVIDEIAPWPPCTCHPDDNPPVPCPRRYALSECLKAEHDRSVLHALEREEADRQLLPQRWVGPT